VQYERLLVPEQAGQFTIPPLEYSIFDPATGEYRTLTTESIPVDIAPGDGLVTQNIAPAINDGQEIVEQVGIDIRHLKPIPAELNFGTQAVTNSPLYWLAWGVPLVGLVGHVVWKRRARYWQTSDSQLPGPQKGQTSPGPGSQKGSEQLQRRRPNPV
jgi:hypothetical protein